MTQESRAYASCLGQEGSTSHLADATNQQHAKPAARHAANEKLKMHNQAARKVDCLNQALVSCLSIELSLLSPLHESKCISTAEKLLLPELICPFTSHMLYQLQRKATDDASSPAALDGAKQARNPDANVSGKSAPLCLYCY